MSRVLSRFATARKKDDERAAMASERAVRTPIWQRRGTGTAALFYPSMTDARTRELLIESTHHAHDEEEDELFPKAREVPSQTSEAAMLLLA
jgi:hypothetical protein